MNEVVPLASARRKNRKIDEPSWFAGMVRDDRGRVIANLANAMVALRQAPDLAKTFAYDEMLRAPLLPGVFPETRLQKTPIRLVPSAILMSLGSKNGCNGKDCLG